MVSPKIVKDTVDLRDVAAQLLSHLECTLDMPDHDQSHEFECRLTEHARARTNLSVD